MTPAFKPKGACAPGGPPAGRPFAESGDSAFESLSAGRESKNVASGFSRVVHFLIPPC
jgi:hypothetical protein